MQLLEETGIRGLLERILERSDITIVDLHTHILSNDVHEKNAEYYFSTSLRQNGIDFIFETEHDRAPLLYGSDKPINGKVRPGVEISTTHGHVNILSVGNQVITACLRKFSEELHRKRRKSRLNLETLLNYIRNSHDSKDYDIAVVYPHSFQQGGLFYNKHNQRYPKLWIPSTYKERKYFLEWTNSKKAPDSRTAEQVIQMVQEPRHNMLLVAGSDAHHSSEVGMAGVVVFGKINGEDITRNLLEENYLIYHIQTFNAAEGRVMTNNPRANNRREYVLHVKGNELTVKEK